MIAHPTRGLHPVRYLPTPTRKPVLPRQGVGTWIRLHKLLTLAIAATLLLAATAVAVLTLRIDATVSPAAKASPVVFQSGSDYTAINTAGFATLTIGTSAASATLTASGVPGAAQVTLGNVMKITNLEAAQAYTVTLSRSTTLDAAVSSLVVTVKDGATTLVTWDPKSAATSASFTLAATKALDVSLAIVIADGTAAGALGSFGMQVLITPA